MRFVWWSRACKESKYQKTLHWAWRKILMAYLIHLILVVLWFFIVGSSSSILRMLTSTTFTAKEINVWIFWQKRDLPAMIVVFYIRTSSLFCTNYFRMLGIYVTLNFVFLFVIWLHFSTSKDFNLLFFSDEVKY